MPPKFDSLSQLPSSDKFQTKLRSRHQRDSLMDLLVASKFLQLLYFDSRTCAPNSPWWWNRFQRHFPSKAKLNFPKSLIPKPPFSFGRQTIPQFTQAIFFWFTSAAPPAYPPLSSAPWKRRKKKIGIEFRTILMLPFPQKRDIFVSTLIVFCHIFWLLNPMSRYALGLPQ